MPKVRTRRRRRTPLRAALMFARSSQMQSGARPVKMIGQMSAECSRTIMVSC
ncbi:MAG: hypothetical protein MZU95_02325 [Desulfomicrobium escambiense]|nr:hypothetical protein [Desulfomicrobium escambiense]